MNPCRPEILEHFIEPQPVLAAYKMLWAPGAAPILCIDGLSGNGKTSLLCCLYERYDPGRVKVLLDLDNRGLAEGHRWLDTLSSGLTGQIREVDLSAYWRAARERDDQREQIVPAFPGVRQRTAARLWGRVENSPQNVHIDILPAIATANEQKAEHDRRTRDVLTKALFDALEPLAGREWVLLVDTYEAVVHLADAEFRGWFEHEFLPTLVRRQPGARVVITGREGLPKGGYCMSAPPLVDWDRAANDKFLEGWGLIDPALQQAVYAHCRGHPLVTDLARKVWEEGHRSRRPLKVGDLRPQTNRKAAIEWLVKQLVARLPARLSAAVRAAAMLRELSLEALNALLSPSTLSQEDYEQRLLDLSCISGCPGSGSFYHVHDLIREVEDSSQRGYPEEYQRLHVAAFEYFKARNDVLNGVYHLLVLNEEAARSEWIQAIDQARLGLDLDSQSQLLALLQMPERIRWLQPHTQAFHSLFSGLLARYQDRLDDALTTLTQAVGQFRTAGDSWGVATATQALGDLYVRTDRLEDALGAYQQALPTYQEIHARLGEANTLQALGRFHSIQGSVVAAEEAFAAALDIYHDIADRYSLAATLAYRGQHRLVHRAYEAGTDWGTALALSIATEPFLARKIIALTFSEARSRCLTGQDDELVAAAVALLLQTAEQTAESLQFAEDQSTTLSIVLDAFRVIGAICAYHTSTDQTEREQYAATARGIAKQVDMITNNAFGLVELIHQRLAVGSASEQGSAGASSA